MEHDKLAELRKRLTEQEVLKSELGSLRKNAEVYKQQQNSGVFFLSSTSQEKSHNKKKMDSLQKEIGDLEKVMKTT